MQCPRQEFQFSTKSFPWLSHSLPSYMLQSNTSRRNVTWVGNSSTNWKNKLKIAKVRHRFLSPVLRLLAFFLFQFLFNSARRIFLFFFFLSWNKRFNFMIILVCTEQTTFCSFYFLTQTHFNKRKKVNILKYRYMIWQFFPS